MQNPMNTPAQVPIDKKELEIIQEKENSQEEEVGKPVIIICCMCELANAVYRCPKCLRPTCSLECCLDHKKKFECDGKRDRTKFIAVSDFTDADLRSDYFLLEEINRSVRSSHDEAKEIAFKRSNKRKRSHENSQPNPDLPENWIARYPKPTRIFYNEANSRGVNLHLLAPGMSKRTKNSSYYAMKKKLLLWRVEWNFPSADEKLTLAEERLADDTLLRSPLEKYLLPQLNNGSIRKKLSKYVTNGFDKIVLLLRKEFVKSSTPQYYRLNLNESLNQNLKRKSVVEYPVILVVLEDDLDQYTIAHDIIEEVAPSKVDE